MATSSIFHHVHIEGERAVQSFLNAVESSKIAKAKRKHANVDIIELKTDKEISDFFAKYKG